jgi:hypothetical protein
MRPVPSPLDHVPHVLFMSAGSKVEGLHANGSITGMEDEVAVRDGSDMDHIAGTVSQHVALLAVFANVGESSVPLALRAFGPVPTAFSGTYGDWGKSRHVLAEKLFDRMDGSFSLLDDSEGVSVPFPLFIVGMAEALGGMRLGADRASLHATTINEISL